MTHRRRRRSILASKVLIATTCLTFLASRYTTPSRSKSQRSCSARDAPPRMCLPPHPPNASSFLINIRLLPPLYDTQRACSQARRHTEFVLWSMFYLSLGCIGRRGLMGWLSSSALRSIANISRQFSRHVPCSTPTPCYNSEVCACATTLERSFHSQLPSHRASAISRATALVFGGEMRARYTTVRQTSCSRFACSSRPCPAAAPAKDRDSERKKLFSITAWVNKHLLALHLPTRGRLGPSQWWLPVVARRLHGVQALRVAGMGGELHAHPALFCCCM
jgi:hypothetical protein